MTKESLKFNDVKSKYFPDRTSLCRGREEGAGHWLVAYRKAEEQKHRKVHRRVKENVRTCEDDRGTRSPHFKTLDRPFLLRLHCVDEPFELCSVDISEQQLNTVKPEDLKVFDNVAYIDASVNSLSLDSFSCFVSLRDLNLSLNGLSNMTFRAVDFLHLEVLDLSFNSLSADGIVSVGRLPRLKILHLTGNQLLRLPSDLGSTKYDASQLPAQEEDTQFKALEVLLLNDNRLSSEVFWSLKNLKRLKRLNLQGNRISEIPYLQPMGSCESLQTFTEDRVEEEGLVSNELNTDDLVKRISQIFHHQNGGEDWNRSSLPLPELRFLNLADNKILEEEALMAAILFPMIREIDISSNPLTVLRSGDPPLLTHYLQERRGVTIKRKTVQGFVKLPLKMAADPKWKVEERITKKPSLKYAPHRAHVEKREVTAKRTPDSVDTKGNDEHFFLTQATDVPEYEFDLQADREITAENTRNNDDDDIPVKFTHYEMLMEANSIPNLGIQKAVRMLDQALRNHNVNRDSKPKLNCIQTPHRGTEKKVKELPPLKPIKQPAERVDEMLKEIRESTTASKVPLSSSLHSRGVNKREALLLLRDMKTKYKRLHKKTMDQVGNI